MRHIMMMVMMIMITQQDRQELMEPLLVQTLDSPIDTMLGVSRQLLNDDINCDDVGVGDGDIDDDE